MEKKATRTHGACKGASGGCDGVSAVCQLLLNIQRAPLGEAAAHTTQPGISLITRCPSGLLYTHSPVHFLLQHPNTPEQQHQQITKHRLAQNGQGLDSGLPPPSCLHIQVFERRRFSVLTTQEFHSSTTLINYVAYFTPLFPPQRIPQSFPMYWKT